MSMYGPMQRIVAVGEHLATGTTVTMACGHQWHLVSHAHMSERSIGDLHSCYGCKTGAPALTDDELELAAGQSAVMSRALARGEGF